MILGGLFDLDSKIDREKEISNLMVDNSFWNDADSAAKLIEEHKRLKEIIYRVESLEKRINDNFAVVNDENDADLYLLAEDELMHINKEMDELEINVYFNGEYDSSNAILEIHAGAGGTESCDWVSMLYRMYTRFAEKNKYKIIEIDKQDGEEAGIRSVMFEINGINAYGYLKNEKGIHRLVRISPFDANRRRHTSFAAVDVMPKIDKDINIIIDDKDIRVDIYRSSGPGGQGVNTTDSAVRITHIPTGIVVTCQNERSQIRNKEMAMEILKNKLYLVEQEKQNEKINGIKGEQLTNGFGSAKRSYVMQPYTLIKDNNSGYESSNVSTILDGEIVEMLEYGLKNKR